MRRMLPLEPHQRRAPPVPAEPRPNARPARAQSKTARRRRTTVPTGYKRRNFRRTQNIRANDAGGAYKAAQGAVGADTQPDGRRFKRRHISWPNEGKLQHAESRLQDRGLIIRVLTGIRCEAATERFAAGDMSELPVRSPSFQPLGCGARRSTRDTAGIRDIR
ncbi:hypothetical protein HYPDE_22623 [Hyphomicrobium denitrificans 1NES1]|uniref:Uncharacterized protein n=1 Tax=Hyphomicrobium denitrificans 1NES1 TaxID=670307 RepID=N0B6P6_9HYPH|nr:hypothetical protein HYPDE_22623 [Hyphomicrobium denitrificans 1NES1]